MNVGVFVGTGVGLPGRYVGVLEGSGVGPDVGTGVGLPGK